MTSAPSASREASRAEPRFTFLAVTSLTFLKPLLRKALRPVAARLYDAGVTANQVAWTSLVGSVLVGALLCRFAVHSALFAILPAWLAARTAFAAIDGTLAIEFGQKSRLGSVLNEAGDVVSDIALFSPLAFIAPFSGPSIALPVCFAAMSEFVGMAGTLLSGPRRPAWQGRPIDRALACRDSDRRLWPASRRLVGHCAGALRGTGHHHLESLSVRAGRAGVVRRIIPWGLTTIIGVPGRSLAVIRIKSR
jgi:CDP-diacylglycerol---glycerol-3-phosphate 3-phosphatidyltransferase